MKLAPTGTGRFYEDHRLARQLETTKTNRAEYKAAGVSRPARKCWTTGCSNDAPVGGSTGRACATCALDRPDPDLTRVYCTLGCSNPALLGRSKFCSRCDKDARNKRRAERKSATKSAAAGGTALPPDGRKKRGKKS